MTVYYRITSKNSVNPSPIHANDKKKLVEMCLKSFCVAFRDVMPDVVFIMDFCPQDWEDMVRKICPFTKTFHFTNLGQNDTSLLQYKLAKEMGDDIILFLEDDYIWRPSVGKQFYEAVDHFGLLSPYNHPNFYRMRELHKPEATLELFNNALYRTAERNTMTFGIRKDVFLKHYDIFYREGYLDGPVWYDTTKAGQPLWVSLPSMATHMVVDNLAPEIPWETLFKLYES